MGSAGCGLWLSFTQLLIVPVIVAAADIVFRAASGACLKALVADAVSYLLSAVGIDAIHGREPTETAGTACSGSSKLPAGAGHICATDHRRSRV